MVLIAQAVYVKRTTPRLPGAAGPTEGLVPGDGEPFRLAVLGESTVDGVGAAHHEEALTGCLARELARDGRSVRWQAVGRTGANARVTRTDLLPLVRPADLVVVALGVNDTIELRSAPAYRRDLLALVVELRRRLGPVRVVLAGVPPMSRFPALPRPLRDVLSARSTALDAAAAALARVPGVTHLPMDPALLDPAAFASDRFHPGPAGYARWAQTLADHIG
ncbi:SGNH/GDSL hydrolase family protein [Amycolatopsis sp. SID8362]|uniref:SGNH/GDSL hydrolase family protein n=1 Tax=Amycolatopsis sp. SID8362 TaxID=2690346 RepID=UPI001368609D|nr:SGNH/GDSL hydrolase family protein [Amycolatopsis sp. SID8362]NBH02044.1 SGNH/GDSL hydrolase family protein [Amycolatopsis sp. SID8362]NED38747.1 SGNH/GDSL hydrolase family protein [Amycolatopsis sp. SID8362]